MARARDVASPSSDGSRICRKLRKGQRRRATIDGPCDLDRLQRAFKLAADRKVCGDANGGSKGPVSRGRPRRATVGGPPPMETPQRTCGSTADGKKGTGFASSSPKVPANEGRPRRATVNGPCQMEDLQRAYKLAADVKIAVGFVDSSTCSSDATVKSGNRTGFEMPRWSRNEDIDSSNRCEPPSPKTSKTGFSTRSRRAVVGDPLSSPQMESLRNDRCKAAGSSEIAGPKFVPPSKVRPDSQTSFQMSPWSRNEDVDSSDRTACEPRSPKSTETSWSSRRVTIGDPLSSAQLESLRRDRRKAAAASNNAGPRFVSHSTCSSDATVKWCNKVGSERPRWLTNEEIDSSNRTACEPPSPKSTKTSSRSRRAMTGDPLSLVQIESSRRDRCKAVVTSKNAGTKFVPPSARGIDATVMSGNKARSEKTSRLRKGDVDASNHTVCETPSPKSSKASPRYRRVTIGDPLSSVQMESLRRDRPKAAAASHKAGPKFIPPLRKYPDEEDMDVNVSERTCVTSFGFSSPARAPLPPRRVTIGDPLSLAQMESLRRDRRKAVTSSKNAGPTFIPPLRNYSDEEAMDVNASERTCVTSFGLGPSAGAPLPPRRVTIGDPLSSAQMESLRGDRRKAVASSKNAGPTFIPPLRNYTDEDDVNVSERTCFASFDLGPSTGAPLPPRRVTIGNPLSSAQMESLRSDRLKAVVAPSKNTGPKFVPPLQNYLNEEVIDVNVSERTCFASSSLESTFIGLAESARRDESANGSTAAALLRDGGETSPSVPGGGKNLPKPRAGLLVRTENKLHESVSSLDESMLSNMTLVSNGSAFDDKEASFRSPFCVSDFEGLNETRQPSGKSKMPNGNTVRGTTETNARPYQPTRRATDCSTRSHSRGLNRRRAGENDRPLDRQVDYIKRMLKDHNKKLDALMMRGQNHRR